MKSILKPSLDWLLIFLPVTIWLHYAKPDAATSIFLCACAAILPLAGWLGRATEHLAGHTGETVGGLLNATFGNAAEFIIALAALRQGLHEVVKASITGSIIGNILLVGGLAMFCGGLRHERQRFRAKAARTQATLLTLAAIALVLPAAFHALGGPAGYQFEADLSLEFAIVLLGVYGAGLLFSLVTHRRMFEALPADPQGGGGEHGPPWSRAKAVAVLTAATALIAWVSEMLVGSVEAAAHTFGMSNLFVGVIVVAVVGNAAEHSTAILMAMKNRMDLGLGIAVGSSIQIALFVAPLLVVAGRFIGPRPLDLVFSPAEVLAVLLAVLITAQVTADGESNWLEGLMLLAVYLMLGVLFFFLPEAAPHAPAH
jgi:Ca2+:H+ antiporter